MNSLINMIEKSEYFLRVLLTTLSTYGHLLALFYTTVGGATDTVAESGQQSCVVIFKIV
jgi:hypothetical protein